VKKRKGNCYVTVEALFHLLGGKAAGYTPQTVRHEGTVHWYLMYDKKHGPNGLYTTIVVDPTASQFKTPPPYHLGRGRGFLTKGPSKRARAMMTMMVYQ
jgi:hypothetical protein